MKIDPWTGTGRDAGFDRIERMSALSRARTKATGLPASQFELKMSSRTKKSQSSRTTTGTVELSEGQSLSTMD